MKILRIFLISSIIVLFISTNLNAQTTICYKLAWDNPSLIEETKLDGGKCKGAYSFDDMKEKGWLLKDLKIEKSKIGFNYAYILSNDKVINDKKKEENLKSNLSFETIKLKLYNIKNNKVKINIANLKIGQSGIVEHTYKNDQSLIVANAYVIESNSSYSILSLHPFLNIKQDALPTSSRKVENGDTLLLNYLYKVSLIIAPSQDAFTSVRAKYTKNNFLHSDLFAAKLKYIMEPLPSKKTIIDFASSQNIGTLFFIIKEKVYILDSKTFSIIGTDFLSYNFIDEQEVPFYTRVKNITKSNLSYISKDNMFGLRSLIDFFKNDKRSEEEILLEDEMNIKSLNLKENTYDDYYEKLLGIK